MGFGDAEQLINMELFLWHKKWCGDFLKVYGCSSETPATWGPAFLRWLWSLSPSVLNGSQNKTSSFLWSLKSVFFELIYLSCFWTDYRLFEWTWCLENLPFLKSWFVTLHFMNFFFFFRAWRMNRSGLKIFLRCTLRGCVTSSSSQAWTSSERPVAATQKFSP